MISPKVWWRATIAPKGKSSKPPLQLVWHSVPLRSSWTRSVYSKNGVQVVWWPLALKCFTVIIQRCDREAFLFLVNEHQCASAVNPRKSVEMGRRLQATWIAIVESRRTRDQPEMPVDASTGHQRTGVFPVIWHLGNHQSTINYPNRISKFKFLNICLPYIRDLGGNG